MVDTEEVPLTQSPSSRSRSGWRTLATVAVVAVVAYFLWGSIADQWAVVRSQSWEIQPGWLLLSAITLWLGVVILIQLWRTLLVIAASKPLGLGAAYRISVLANLGKYVPGKIWSVMGLIYMVTKEGHPPQSAVAATILHQAYTIVSGIVFVSVILGAKAWGQLPIAVVFAGLALSLCILYPPVFSWTLNRGLRLLKRSPVNLQLSFPRAVLLFFGYVMGWIVYGAGFWLLALGVGLPSGPFWPIVASFGAAYLAGFLALFAPGGLGVREGILAILLASFFPAGLPATIAVISRIWMTLIELAGLLPLFFYRKESAK